jgi:hypothetical protein
MRTFQQLTSATVFFCAALPALAAETTKSREPYGYELLVNCVRTGSPELFVVDPDTGDARNLTHHLKAETRYPMWSPDGKRIVFTAERDGHWELYLIDADGKNLKQLTHKKTTSYWPNWRGDGKQIIFGFVEGRKSMIGSIEPNGSNLKTLGEGGDPCISPDGKSIAFVKHLPKGACLFVMDPDGKNVRQLTTRGNGMGTMHPFWSPDSKHVLYSDQVGDKLEIFQVDADGKNVKQLTKLGKISTSPHVSPDGKWIAFRSTPTPFWADAKESEKTYREKPPDKRPVYAMRADGSDVHVIETLHYQIAMDGSRPAWRPIRPPQREASPRKTPYPAKVSDNHRYLLDRDGKPFFWLGDTAWELFHRLNREEADHYLQDRAKKKFTVIQAVVLAELDGLNTPNPYGHRPLKDKDPTKTDEDYFKHVDYVVNKADELGLVIGMLPTWGDKWHGPKEGGIFTPENAAIYGEFLGKRYRDKPIVWILGGDRSVDNERHKAILRAMATGLKKGDGGRHLMTFHPPGGNTSAQWFHDDKWLSLNMLQTGHGYNHHNYHRVAKDYQRQPTKPCVDGEPSYEDHPAEFNAKNGYTTDYDVRKGAYWALFAGACGHTYGCHDIWQFFAEGRQPITSARTPWRKALQLPGASQVQYARALLESRPILNRIPDQSLIASDAGKGTDRVQATRAEDGSYAFVYVASGKAVTVDLGKLSGKELKAYWYDPRSGEAKEIGTFARSGKREFTPPSSGAGNDWVLVLDDVARKYPPPGKR